MITEVKELKKTPLYDQHVALGAKMVPFAGWQMPVQYNSMIEEHLAVRNSAGLFDVSHMGLVKVVDPAQLIISQHTMLSRAVDKMEPGQIRYNRFINDQGGVVDDILVYRDFENYLLVLNASNVQKDINFLESNGVEVEDMQLMILALQGPKSVEVLQNYTEDNLAEIGYYNFIALELNDGDEVIDAIVSRTGYTGEDGFEIMVSAADMAKVWGFLLQDPLVKPCGLGARDSLRIEAGMPLYGHEMRDDWSSAKTNSLVGLKLLQKSGVPREGYDIVDKTGALIGEVTSGAFSPVLKEPVAIAYIDGKAIGDKVFVDIRGKEIPAQVVKLPFVNNVRKKSS